MSAKQVKVKKHQTSCDYHCLPTFKAVSMSRGIVSLSLPLLSVETEQIVIAAVSVSCIFWH